MVDPQNPSPSKSQPQQQQDCDFLLHLESDLARRDGVGKLLKISRYTAKLLLSTPFPLPLPQTLAPNLRSFDSSIDLSRKAFRLGKFDQDLNSLRFANPSSPFALTLLAYCGEGIYYFVEQLVWLSKMGLISSTHAKRLSKISAWAEFVGYLGSISLKVRDSRELRLKLEVVDGENERGKLRETLAMKELSIMPDLADALMALADVRDGNGPMMGPMLMASAGLCLALISAHKNWKSC